MKSKLFILFIVIGSTLSAQYKKLYDFNLTSGYQPNGSLVFDGAFLYGMTSTGSPGGVGTIFKIKPDGTGYTTLKYFNPRPDGQQPQGSLFFDGTFLYGTTPFGGNSVACGQSGCGIIFKIKPDSSGYSKIMDFDYDSTGISSGCTLISDGTFLYGTGGWNVFKIMPDGSGYSKLYDFVPGQGTRASLVFDGTFLYNMNPFGGTGTCGVDGCGIIFKIKPDGTGFSKIFDFSGTADGRHPQGSLISDGTFMYGMTEHGGSWDMGVIFKIKPDGSGYVKLMDLDPTTGSFPRGSLILDGGFLYGMTYDDGAHSFGTIFKIKTDGTGFADMLDFDPVVTGNAAASSLISDGTFLYGMTTQGGVNNGGTIFRFRDSTSTTCNASIAGNTKICLGQTATLTASGGLNYLWSNGGTTASIIISPTIITTYSVTATTGTCVASASTTIIVNQPPNLSLTLLQDTVNQLLWYATPVIMGTGPFTYYWDFGDGSISTLATPSHTYVLAGHYAICLTITDSSGCSSSTCDSTYKISLSGGTIQYLNVKNAVISGIENLKNQTNVLIFPNPTRGIFIVQSSEKTSSIQIVNLLGENIYLSQLNSNKAEVDLSSQPNGVYFLQLATDKGIARKKIVISK